MLKITLVPGFSLLHVIYNDHYTQGEIVQVDNLILILHQSEERKTLCWRIICQKRDKRLMCGLVISRLGHEHGCAPVSGTVIQLFPRPMYNYTFLTCRFILRLSFICCIVFGTFPCLYHAYFGSYTSYSLYYTVVCNVFNVVPRVM